MLPDEAIAVLPLPHEQCTIQKPIFYEHQHTLQFPDSSVTNSITSPLRRSIHIEEGVALQTPAHATSSEPVVAEVSSYVTALKM